MSGKENKRPKGMENKNDKSKRRKRDGGEMKSVFQIEMENHVVWLKQLYEEHAKYKQTPEEE